MHAFYLLLGLGTVVPVLIVWRCRPDLRTPIWQAGLVGAAIQAVSGQWLASSWHPLTLLPVAAPEDLVYGFGITALCVCIYPVLCHQTVDQLLVGTSAWRATGIGVTVAAACIIAMKVVDRLYTQSLPGVDLVPSVVGIMVLFTVGFVAVCIRTEMLSATAFTLLAMAIITLAYYAVGLNLVAPILGVSGNDYLKQVYLLYGTAADRRLGGVPMDALWLHAMHAWAAFSVYAACSRCRFTPSFPVRNQAAANPQ